MSNNNLKYCDGQYCDFVPAIICKALILHTYGYPCCYHPLCTFGLIDVDEARYIWKVDKLDFLACIGAFVGVLFASVEIGLLVTATISFAKILIQSIRPGVEILGRVLRTEAFCDGTQYPMAVSTPDIIVICTSSGSLCFANANFINMLLVSIVSFISIYVVNPY